MALISWTQEFIETLPKTFKNIDWHAHNTRLALISAIATPLAVWIAWLLNIDNPFWAGISAFVIVQSSNGATLHRGLSRMAATIGGAITGMILVNLFGSNPPIFLLAFFLVNVLALYISNKSNNPYIWILGAGTLAMVALCVYTDPYDVADTAYYRSLEVFIGILVAWAVGSLLHSQQASKQLAQASTEITLQLGKLHQKVVAGYAQGQMDPEFMPAARALLALVDKHIQLRKFAIQENFARKKAFQSETFEEAVIAITELLIASYSRYQVDLGQFGKQFSATLQALEAEAMNTFNLIEQVIQGPQGLAKFQTALQQWRAVINELFSQYEVLRTHHQTINYSIAAIAQWHQWLSMQRNVCQILENFSIDSKSTSIKIPWQNRLESLLSFDRYYWYYGIKGALMITALPLLGVWMNIPGESQIGVSVIAVLQMDLINTGYKSFLRALGCFAGLLVALVVIGFNIENLVWYLLIFGLVMGFFGYIQHSNARLNYFGIQGGVAFILAITSGLGPMTVLAPTVERLAGILVGVVGALWFITAIWPMTKSQTLHHYLLQINRYGRLVQTELLRWIQSIDNHNASPQIILRHELSGIRQNAIQLNKIPATELNAYQIPEGLIPAIRHYYHNLFNIMLAWQTYPFSAEYEQQLPIKALARQILPYEAEASTLQAASKRIDELLTELRMQAQQGKLLPTEIIVAGINLLKLLQEFAEHRQQMLSFSATFLQANKL